MARDSYFTTFSFISGEMFCLYSVCYNLDVTEHLSWKCLYVCVYVSGSVYCVYCLYCSTDASTVQYTG